MFLYGYISVQLEQGMHKEQLGQKLFRDLYTSTRRGGEYRPWSKTTIVKKNIPQVVETHIFRELFGPGVYPETSRESPGTP